MGLAAAGYRYRSFIFLFFCISVIRVIFSVFSIVNMDDCWQVSRDAQDIIQADPYAFLDRVPQL